MPNLITGLKYQSPNPTVETEQELLQVFTDLKEQYTRFNKTFKIFTQTGEPLTDFEHFLKLAVQEKQAVVLTGSGDIGGLVVQNASLEYDLSPVGDLTKFWDIYQNGSCHSCRNHTYEQIGMEMENSCIVFGREKMNWHDCQRYDAKRKNSEGKAARKLNLLVLEAIQ